MDRRLGGMVLQWLLMASSAWAASGPSSALPIGSLVMAKRPGVYFRIQNEESEEMHCGVTRSVQRVEGDWLWLGRGWVQRSDVIPLWEAVEYFTTEIKRKETAFAHIGRAAAARIRGAYAAEVDSDVKAALQLDPNFAAAHLTRGTKLFLEGKLDDAIEARQ